MRTHASRLVPTRSRHSLVAAALLILVVPGTVVAREATWTTDPAVGASTVDLTISVTCTGNPVVCGVFSSYESTRTPELSGSGTAVLTEGGTLTLVLDTDLIDPPVRAWTVDAEPFSFDPIPLVGTPTVTSGRVFGTEGGPIAIPGLAFGAFGAVPVSETLRTGMSFDLSGLTVPFPDQQVGPAPTPIAGTFEMLDVSRFEVRDLTWSLDGVETTDLEPGELTVTTTGAITLNLSGELGIRLSLDGDLLSWTPVADVFGYDVVEGDLALLASTGGDFTVATTSCLADDVGATGLAEGTTPDPGEGRWFLVRAVRLGGSLSYDSLGLAQVASRDAGITVCP